MKMLTRFIALLLVTTGLAIETVSSDSDTAPTEALIPQEPQAAKEPLAAVEEKVEEKDDKALTEKKEEKDKKPEEKQALSGEQLLEIMKRFAPMVYLYDSDPFRPADFNWYIGQCKLVDGDTVHQPGTFDGQTLAGVTNSEAYLTPVDKKATYPGQPIVNEHSDAPCYVNVVPNWVQTPEGGRTLASIILQYYFFYAFNGPTIPKTTIGTHEADWEHINVHLKATHEPSPSEDAAAPVFTVEKIFYAAHKERRNGHYVKGDQVKFCEGTHPLVYSSKYGHASHPQLFHFVNAQLDLVDDTGPRWNCWEHAVYLGTREAPSGQTPWLPFQGKCGAGGAPRMPTSQKTWRVAEQAPKCIATIQMRLSPLKGESSRASQDFSLVDKIPTRVQRLYWEIDHPQAADITFSVHHHRPSILLKDEKNIYEDLVGSGTETKVASEDSHLYIARVRVDNPAINKADSVTLKIYVVEEK